LKDSAVSQTSGVENRRTKSLRNRGKTRRKNRPSVNGVWLRKGGGKWDRELGKSFTER